MKTELKKLRDEFGENKSIPPAYEWVILTALSHSPELKRTRIQFRFRKKCPVPYGTKPAPSSLLKANSKRLYVMTFLEKAKPPMQQALFHHLPPECQVGVVGHELGHVLQYESCSKLELLKLALKMQLRSFQSQFESGTDRLAIEHGLGEELYKHAVYIRSIPGYPEQRKNLDRNYLRPGEILEYLGRLRGLPERY